MANSSQKKKDQDWGIWALIIFLFAIGLSPIALLLLFIKLFGKDEETKKTSSSTSSEGRTRKTGAAGKTARKTVRKAMKSPIAKRSTVRWLKIGGAALLLIGLLACMEPIDMMLWENRIVSYYMEDLVAAVAMAVGGILMLCNGVSMERSMKRYTKYLAVMGDRDAVAVKELARTLGYSTRRVSKDLEKMIDRGYFGGKAYLHAELGYLLRSGDADAVQKQQPVAAEPETETGYAAILQNIQRANDAIADPVLSAKIDRLEEISSRIFRIVEETPQKRGKIETFLNYYLPTTQKLLDSYAQFEAAGVEGENLRQAKQRIEATMDSIVRGFEHQLDELYHADALDIDSDIRVMETMLRRDTATVEEDFGMGVMAQKMED